MKEQSRYRYEQTIKHLTEELAKTRAARDIYRTVCSDIFDALANCTAEQHLSNGWVHKQFKRLWRYP